MCSVSAGIDGYHVRAMPTEARRGSKLDSFMTVSYQVWVLGTESRSSARSIWTAEPDLQVLISFKLRHWTSSRRMWAIGHRRSFSGTGLNSSTSKCQAAIMARLGRVRWEEWGEQRSRMKLENSFMKGGGFPGRHVWEGPSLLWNVQTRRWEKRAKVDNYISKF